MVPGEQPPSFIMGGGYHSAWREGVRGVERSIVALPGRIAPHCLFSFAINRLHGLCAFDGDVFEGVWGRHELMGWWLQ
jgi:hypothetical protein